MFSSGAQLVVENIPFSDEGSCNAALSKILNGYEKDPVNKHLARKYTIGDTSTVHIDGWCVSNDTNSR